MADLKARVGIAKCADYKKENLENALKKSMDFIGGLKKYIKPGSKVVVKPNLLLPAKPEKAIITHPFFLETVINMAAECTGDSKDVLIADSFSPAVPFTPKGINRVYEETGIFDIAGRTGCSLNFSTGYRSISYREGIILKKIDIIEAVLGCSSIINLPKFKTHNLTVMTGAVKNMFGVVPGFTKATYHLRFDKINDFVSMLLDIVNLVKPSVNIMDGILGMEGEGPGTSGTPRKVGLILSSDNALAIDAVASRIMGIDERFNPLLVTARKNSMEGADPDNIEVAGYKLDDLIIKGFRLPKTAGQARLIRNDFISTYVLPIIRNSLNPYPVIDRKKCNLCLTCKNVCPQKIIDDNNGKLSFDYRSCIRCFCCSEMCPEGAIDIRYSFLGNLLINRLGLAGKRIRKD